MKIYYMNDETKPITVRTIDMFGENTYTTLKPLEAKVFAFNTPVNATAFVKRWDNNTVLLSYIVSLPQESGESSDTP